MRWFICLFRGHERNLVERRWLDEFYCDRCENWIEEIGAHR